MSFKDISYLELLQPTFSAKIKKHLNICCKGHHEEHFFEIILNLDKWFRKRCCFKTFLNMRVLATSLFGGVEPFVQFW